MLKLEKNGNCDETILKLNLAQPRAASAGRRHDANKWLHARTHARDSIPIIWQESNLYIFGKSTKADRLMWLLNTCFSKTNVNSVRAHRTHTHIALRICSMHSIAWQNNFAEIFAQIKRNWEPIRARVVICCLGAHCKYVCTLNVLNIAVIHLTCSVKCAQSPEYRHVSYTALRVLDSRAIRIEITTTKPAPIHFD